MVRFEAAPGNVIGHYEHVQGGRGVNGVLVELADGTTSWRTTSPCTSPSPARSTCVREDVPADVVEAERKTLETITRNEGKPEQAVPKIVEGRLNGFFKDVCLLEQPYAKDDKQSIKPAVGARVDLASPRSRSADPVAAVALSTDSTVSDLGGSESSSSLRVRRLPARAGGGSTARRSTRPRRRSPTSARTSTSTSPSSSVAATSGAVAPGMEGMDATQSDHIGMLGTVMDALALQDALERHGQATRFSRRSRCLASPSLTSVAGPSATSRRVGS